MDNNASRRHQAIAASTMTSRTSMSTVSSRQHDHDDPPPLPTTSIASTEGGDHERCTTSDEETKSASTINIDHPGVVLTSDDPNATSASIRLTMETTIAIEDSEVPTTTHTEYEVPLNDMVLSSQASPLPGTASSPPHTPSPRTPSHTTPINSATSSARFSDSNYSSCSTGSTGRRIKTRNSLELRKVPIDTALFSSNSTELKQRNDQDNQQGTTGVEGKKQVGLAVLDNSDSTFSREDASLMQSDESFNRRRRGLKRQLDKDMILTDKEVPTSRKEPWARRFLRLTCLRPNLSLQSQLLLSFGLVSTVTILFVMVICIVVPIIAGNEVNDLTQASLEKLATEIAAKNSRYIAETLEVRLLPNHLVDIFNDAATDRLIGYPNYPGYENDTLTPFPDIYTQQNIYPVKGPQLLLDWNLTDLLTPENAAEHVQERYGLYELFANVTTAHAAYSVQGSCNPQASRGDYDWYENCSDENNDMTTGGAVHPVSTNFALFERSADLVPLMKALYEDTPNMREAGICFANDGAGSCLTFPGYTVNGNNSYVSEGCDWMNQPNPYDPSRPIGTPEMIARCHAKGEVVYNREYNALERSWCTDQALNPDMVRVVGPIEDAWNPEHQLMLAGKALYDPLTKEFIGCSFMDFTITNVHHFLDQSKVTENSHVTVAKWNPDGSVDASSAWNLSEFQDIPKVQDLNIGVSRERYQQFYEMVDFSAPWDPQGVMDIYANSIQYDKDQGFLVGGYPLPVVPSTYDSTYRPGWMIILSISTEDVLRPAYVLNEIVDDKVDRLVYISFVAGFIGWVVVMALIIVVSRTLTLPLQRMNQVARAIVNNFGETSEQQIQYGSTDTFLGKVCTPHTELSLVVREFERMVKKFSGTSKMSRAVQERFAELANQFSFHLEFEDLYQKRKSDRGFRYSYDENTINSVEASITNQLGLQRKKEGYHMIHFGSILANSSNPSAQSKCTLHDPLVGSSNKQKRFTSPLFLWIVAFIVTPLLITTVTMTVVVTVNVADELTEVIDDGKAEYVQLEKFALVSTVGLRASWIEGTTEKSTLMLHIISRYASWLLFGGLERRGSITELTTGADQCKTEEKPWECDYLDDFPCECSWSVDFGTCQNLSVPEQYGFRYLQKPYVICETHDTDSNGNRNASLSFPNVSYSPATTAWLRDLSSAPGNEEGSISPGYETTHDRLRALSAIPMFPNLYNFGFKRAGTLGTAVAMELDGMTVGYYGCSKRGEFAAAFWESTTRNQAHDIRPNLCPIGKFGFDPRCRDWYDMGRSLAIANETELYVTAPYLFATGQVIGQTCTSAIMNPFTGEHIGQAYVDYRSDLILDLLGSESTVLVEGGFPILVAARPGRNGADAILGPGYNGGQSPPTTIDKVVLRNDLKCSEAWCERNVEDFESFLSEIKSGKMGTTDVSVRSDDGTNEQYFVAYAPVTIRTYHSIDSSDFTRGVRIQSNAVYYLALAEPEAALVAAFDEVEDGISQTIDVGIAVLSIAILLAIASVICISYWVAMSITEPMLYLLELVRHINELDSDALRVNFDKGSGSLEVKNVANTMGTLYRIVQCANSAYFAGEIDKAYAVLVDAARLFKRIDNSKAVGVAYNNLGNTMLAMYRSMKDTGVEKFCGLTRSEIVLKGMKYFQQSIQLGEKAYDEFYETEGWSPSCLDFMQHLANRYFNRAMFLLTVKEDHANPTELEALGTRDLQIARDMDVEIVDQGTEVGWKVNTIEKLYKVSLNRIRGHLLLLEMGYADEWDVEDLLEESFETMKKELETKADTSELFQELSPTGRMQQLETELMRYWVVKEDIETSAKIAIRMLMEDEFILPEAQLKAIEVLHSSLAGDDSRSHLRGQLVQYELYLRKAKADCDAVLEFADVTTEEDVSEVVMMSVAKLNVLQTEDSEHEGDISISKNCSLIATTRGDVTMETF